MQEGYLNEKTIVALSTPVGGAIAIIRLSGSECFKIVSRLTNGLTPKSRGELVFGHVYDREKTLLDEVVIGFYQNPKSYTGEDVAEIQCHGSAWIASQIIDEAVYFGAKHALPGEFTFRAVKNGKKDIFQAQAVADLIESSNAEATQLALEKMSGVEAQWRTELAEDLRGLAATSELGIDFSDQDIDELTLGRIKERLEKTIAQLQKLKNSFSRGRQIQEGMRTVLVGLPNAGKSSFFNLLCGYERSIVTEIPGTTRDLVREKITLRSGHKSLTLSLNDTAGLRKSDDIVENLGVGLSQTAAKEADLILLLIDPRETKTLQTELKALGDYSNKTIGILNKQDLVEGSLIEKLKLDLIKDLDISGERWVTVSSRSQWGIENAVSKIVEFGSLRLQRQPKEILLTRQEQLRAVESALECLDRAKKTDELDLFSADIRQAIYMLSPIIGETLPDDILGKIFSQFCIGK